MSRAATSGTTRGTTRCRADFRRHRASNGVAAAPAPPPSTGGWERPYPSWLVGAPLERLRWDDPKVERFLRSNLPVVLTGGCPLARDLIGRWSFDYLSQHYDADADSAATLSAHFAPRATRRFNRFYGKGLGKGGVRSMSFREFAETAAANERDERPAWRYYLQSLLVWGDGRGRGTVPGGELRPPGLSEAEQSSRLGSPLHRAQLGPQLAEDVRKRIGWSWLADAVRAAGSEGVHSCTMWAGFGGGQTPLHFDAISNFFCQLAGRKSVLIFPPSQSFNLYPYPRTHPMDTYAMVDPDLADTSRFPALADARALEVVLAEPIDGPVVNSERAERTSDEDFERMMAIGAGRWPSETGRSPFL